MAHRLPLAPLLLALSLLLAAGCTGELASVASKAPDSKASPDPTTPFLPGSPAPRLPPESEQPPQTLPGYGLSTLRLLTPSQYRHAITQLVGRDIKLDVPDIYTSSLAAAVGGVGRAAVESYADLSYTVAAALFDPKDTTTSEKMACALEATADGPCTTAFLGRFARLAWRRPVDEAELSRYVALARDITAKLGSPEKGVEYAVAGILQSPYFLYRVELGAPSAGQPRRAYTPYELATRLSFFLVDAPPSAKLLLQAEAGELDTPEGIEAVARGLLMGPKGLQAFEALGDELFGIENILHVQKDPSLFPQFDPKLAMLMRDQARKTFVDHLASGRDYRELFTRQDLFMHQDLHTLYGLPPADTLGRPDWYIHTFDPSHNRHGILSLAGIMSLHSGIANTSPTVRGFFVSTALLCKTVPPPGPEVDTTLPVPQEGELLTNRELLSRHVTEPSCAGCHKMMDPLGFPLENYDPIGQYRQTQNGKPIDASGELDFSTFDDVEGFAKALSQDPSLTTCVTRKLMEGVLARGFTSGDRPALAQIHQAFADSGYDFREAMIAMAKSDAMRFAHLQEGDSP